MLKMKKLYFTILVFLLGTLSLVGQDMQSVFQKMPRGIIYGLTSEMKEELLENPRDTSRFVGTYIYEKIRRKEVNTEFISLKTSEVGKTEIRLLPLINASKIVCVVQTVESGIADSKIYFYTDKWEPIDAKGLFPEVDVNWFIKEGVDRSSEKFQRAMIALSLMKPVKLTLSPNEAAIEVEYDPKSFLSIDDYKLVEPFLTKKPKMLYWDKTKFN